MLYFVDHHIRGGRLRLFILAFISTLAATVASAQQTVDKTVATVSDGARTEVILYSDVLWQLALQPGVLLDPPRKEDLTRALNTLIDQRLISLEAERIPRSAPTDAEIDTEIKLTLSRFSSPDEFQMRLRQVGFQSVKDDNFERLISRRLAIEKFIDFRFRSFVVVSADEESRYYRDTFVPDFTKRYPGVVLPTIDDKRAEIHDTIVEDRVAARIERFLDDLKRRTEIDYLTEF